MAVNCAREQSRKMVGEFGIAGPWRRGRYLKRTIGGFPINCELLFLIFNSIFENILEE